jgi:hypothetical protein
LKPPASWRVGAACTLLASAAVILSTRLAWGPVPWPDASAFYLPGVELLHWPPSWRMHAQAAFVPTYDQANFNIMPALPILLGLTERLGLIHAFEPQLVLRAVSLVALLAWAWLLWSWLVERLGASSRKSLAIASVVAFAALWDPVVRWGTLVVRTETWIGLCWLWILRELDRRERAGDPVPEWPRTAWRVSAALAVAAYFHFEAVYLVPAAVVALGFRPGWPWRLLDIAWRTLALLSPWILYALAHPSLFAEQMQVQFFRLAHHNHWMSNAYMIFHSLFVEHGSPAGAPKIFNVGKAVFWIGLVMLVVATVATTATTRIRRRRAVLASALAFASCFYLWATKAEVWFVALCHLMFWPWVAAAVARLFDDRGKPDDTQASARAKWLRPVSVALVSAYAALSLVAAAGQIRATDPDYTWPLYQGWIDCIERASAAPASPDARPGLKLWQPHVPDILVELSRRHPDWDLTRALDFPARESLALEAGRRMDAIVFTRAFNRSESGAGRYTGTLRPFDRDILSRGVDTPFGPWALDELLGHGAAHWVPTVCETGPLWAVVLSRRAG